VLVSQLNYSEYEINYLKTKYPFARLHTQLNSTKSPSRASGPSPSITSDLKTIISIYLCANNMIVEHSSKFWSATELQPQLRMN
jgi:hypothetical protein